jgi:hypothetical protein
MSMQAVSKPAKMGLKRLKRADEPAQPASAGAKQKHAQAAVASELEDDVANSSPAQVD